MNLDKKMNFDCEKLEIFFEIGRSERIWFRLGVLIFLDIFL